MKKLMLATCCVALAAATYADAGDPNGTALGNIETNTLMYSQSDTDTLLGRKADYATTLTGYGIEDAYIAQDLTESFYNIVLGLDTLPIHNWALASTKPSYNFSEILSTPKTLSGYGITNAVENVTWDSTNKKLQKTINGTTSDIATLNYSAVGAAASSHTHGNITSGGGITATGVTIANGDTLVIVDSSDSNKKLAKTSISFDGSTATKYLSQKGTWESLATYLDTSDFADVDALVNSNPDTLNQVITQQAAIITKLNAILAILKGSN